MRPILLMGHQRSLTKVKYNHDGDLLFSASKDKSPNVWFSHNGERLGTFNGHQGTIWDLDVSFDSKRLLSGGADQTLRLWNVYTGKELFKWATPTSVRSVCFAHGDKKALFVTDAIMGHKCMIHIVHIEENFEDQTSQVEKTIIIEGPKATIAKWGPLNKFIYTGHEDGQICVWNPETGERVQQSKPHDGQIQDLQFNKDQSFFITASKDTSSLILDTKTLKVLKRYQASRNINSAAISPIKEQIILGGGQEAIEVTTTSAKKGQFEVRFFHLILEEEIGRVKGHFGPINTLAFHPEGKSFASGGEDGYVRLHHFDEDYYDFKYDEE